jgi:hypothetical protein
MVSARWRANDQFELNRLLTSPARLRRWEAFSAPSVADGFKNNPLPFRADVAGHEFGIVCIAIQTLPSAWRHRHDTEVGYDA